MRLIQVTALIAVLSGASRAEDGITEVVAIQGDMPPDGNGTMAQFSVPVLNDAGQLAFGAMLINTNGGPDDDYGIYRADATPGSLVTIIREFVSAFGTGTTELDEIPAINNAGQVATHKRALGLFGGDRDQYFIGDGSAGVTISPFGQSAPDDNGTFTDTLPAQPVLNDAGVVAFEATLSDTDGGTSDDSGLFLGDDSSPLVQIVREGQTAPNGVGVFLGFSKVSLNGGSEVSWTARLSDSNGLFRGDGGPVVRHGRTGQPAPDGSGPLIGPFGGSGLSNTSTIAWPCSVDSAVPLRVIFRGDGGVLTEIVRDGDPAPDGDGTFEELVRIPSPFGPVNLACSVNDSGQVTFRARLDGTTATHGVFRGDGTTVTQIARTKQPSPDGVGTFAELTTRELTHPNIAECGQVLFSAKMGGAGVDSTNDYGIFLGDGQDALVVTREGQALAGSTIDSLGFDVAFSLPTGVVTSPDRGGRSPINVHAQVAFKAVIANGAEGVFLFSPALKWRHADNGGWDDRFNWTLGIDPASPHPVSISPSSAATVTGPAAPTVVRSLTLGTGAGAATLILQPVGELTIPGGMIIGDAGALVGEGAVIGDVSNGGAVIPGTSVASLFVDGIYEQTGELIIEIESTVASDALIVSGHATLGGDLTLTLMPGFIPASTDQFEVLSAASISGTFAPVSGPRGPQVVYESDRVVVTYPCATDTNGDGFMDVTDLLMLLASWGPCPAPCGADIDSDGTVDITDLLALLASWGACP